MPHITIKCYKGRTKEELDNIAKKLADYAAESFGTKRTSISVTIKEVDKEEWKDVYDNDIYGDPENLRVEPGYKM